MSYKLQLIKSHKYNGKKYPTILHLGEDVYCPLCLKKISRKHVHHVVFREHGGADRKENLIVICISCHDAIHHDTTEDGLILKMRLWHYMTAIYGLSAEQNKEMDERVKSFLISNPELLEGGSLLKAYRIADEIVFKEHSKNHYRMSFDPNVIYILLDEFYGD